MLAATASSAMIASPWTSSTSLLVRSSAADPVGEPGVACLRDRPERRAGRQSDIGHRGCFLKAETRHGGDQRAAGRRLRLGDDTRGRAALDDPAGIHDRDAMRRSRARRRGRARRTDRRCRCSRCRSTSRSRILPRTETSSADTASSSTIRSGLVASARAIATRWRWPPEISWMARRGQRGVEADAFEQTARSPPGAASRSAMPWMRSGSASAPATVARGLKAASGSWNTIWMRLRIGAQRLAARAHSRSTPPKSIAAGVRLDEAQQHARQRRLPAARGPDEAERLARARRAIDTSSSAATRRPPVAKVFEMPAAASSGAVMPPPPRSAAACRDRSGFASSCRV